MASIVTWISQNLSSSSSSTAPLAVNPDHFIKVKEVFIRLRKNEFPEVKQKLELVGEAKTLWAQDIPHLRKNNVWMLKTNNVWKQFAEECRYHAHLGLPELLEFANKIEAKLSMNFAEFQADIKLLCAELKIIIANITKKKINFKHLSMNQFAKQWGSYLIRTYNTILNLLERSKHMLINNNQIEKENARTLLESLEKLIFEFASSTFPRKRSILRDSIAGEFFDYSRIGEAQAKIEAAICQSILRTYCNTVINQEDVPTVSSYIHCSDKSKEAQDEIDQLGVVQLLKKAIETRRDELSEEREQEFNTIKGLIRKHLPNLDTHGLEPFLPFVKKMVRMTRHGVDDHGYKLPDNQARAFRNLLIKLQDAFQNHLAKPGVDVKTVKNAIRLASLGTPGIMTPCHPFNRWPDQIRIFINEFNADEMHSLMQMRNYTDRQQNPHFYSWLNSYGCYIEPLPLSLDDEAKDPNVDRERDEALSDALSLTDQEVKAIHQDLIAEEPRLRRFHPQASPTVSTYLDTLGDEMRMRALARLISRGEFLGGMQPKEIIALAAQPALFSPIIKLHGKNCNVILEIIKSMVDCPERRSLLLTIIDTCSKDKYPSSEKMYTILANALGSSYQDQIVNAIEGSSKAIALPQGKAGIEIIEKIKNTALKAECQKLYKS